MKVLPALTSILIISASLAGCIGGEGSDEAPLVIEETFGAFSVVAPVDTGINVYHNHFSMNESYPQWLLDQLGVNKVCEISKNGTWEERYEADRESCWDVIGSGDIVWFKGSRIIGTTPDDYTDIPILDDPSDGHGTAVTGAVIDANPDAVIFFVEGFSDAAVLAAANQPLVDLITN